MVLQDVANTPLPVAPSICVRGWSGHGGLGEVGLVGDIPNCHLPAEGRSVSRELDSTPWFETALKAKAPRSNSLLTRRQSD